MKNLGLGIILVFCFLFAAPSSTVDLAVTVVGNVFTLELQDANAFPLAGQIDLGQYEPGNSDFPVQGVVVAGCKSNTGAQWSLQTELVDQFTEPASGRQLPEGAVRARGLSPNKSPEGATLPGNLIVVEQPLLSGKPLIVYTSDNKGDLGFNKYAGTYVPLGFGVAVPQAQAKGSYSGKVLVTLTE